MEKLIVSKRKKDKLKIIFLLRLIYNRVSGRRQVIRQIQPEAIQTHEYVIDVEEKSKGCTKKRK